MTVTKGRFVTAQRKDDSRVTDESYMNVTGREIV